MNAHKLSRLSTRLHSNLGKKLLLDGSTLARFASQMQTFQDSEAVVSSIRLLRCVMATESIKLVAFIESKEFCKPISKMFIAIVFVKVETTSRFSFAPLLFKNGLGCIRKPRNFSICDVFVLERSGTIFQIQRSCNRLDKGIFL